MGKWIELETKSKCGHIMVAGCCANCGQGIVSRKTRLRNGKKLCKECKHIKYEDLESNQHTKRVERWILKESDTKELGGIYTNTKRVEK